MAFCRQCGSYVSEPDTNCRACGAIVYPSAAASMPAAPEKRPVGTGLRVAIAVVALLCVATAALWAILANVRQDAAVSPGSNPMSIASTPVPRATPEPTSEPAALRSGSWWHGFMFISSYEGNDETWDGSYEIWGYIGTDSDGRSFFELYDSDTVDDDTFIILSMYVELYSDHFVPVIGEEDAWLLDLYLSEADTEAFTLYFQGDSLEFRYAYQDGENACDVSVVVYPK